jgi:signal transduction histidine kinase
VVLPRDAESASGNGIELSRSVSDEEVLEDLKIVFFRVAQESVTNAIRHGGNAGRIGIGLERNDGWLRLKVEDNGKSFDAQRVEEPTGGIGLNSMQQRVDYTGGIFSINSTSGRGTTFKAEWRLLGI